MAEEWPLLVFSVLGQLSIGTFIMLSIVRTFLKTKVGAKAADDLTRIGILAVGPVLLVALIATFFHLGSPTNAFYAVVNIQTSWLSREIFFTGLFFMLWAVTFFLSKKDQPTETWEWIASIVGIIAILSMAGVYAHSNKPAWTNVNTYLAFLGAACFMGAIAAGTVVTFGMKEKQLEESVQKVLRQVNLIAFGAIAIQLIILPIYVSYLAGAGEAAKASAELLFNSYFLLFALKWVLSISVAALMYYGITRRNTKQEPAGTIMYTALGGAILGEFIGRYIFYAMAVSAIFGG